MKLLSDRSFAEEYAARLRSLEPGLRLVYVPRREEDHFLAEAVDADIIYGSFGGGSGAWFPRVIRAATRVRWIHTTSAGVDEILCPEVYERDFVLTCAKGEAVASLLAEHAFALLLALTRSIVPAARRRNWDRGAFQEGPVEIRGMTMGIVGFGAVGQALADRALAFGMRVLGIRAHPGVPPPGVEDVWGVERLPELLARSDAVVLLFPHTPTTAGSFGEQELRQMKRTAYLINVGRGQVMVGAAVERALVEGWIAGAGLDVMPEEPWPASSPLWQMDNVIITPHIAGNGPQRAGRDVEAFAANLARFLRGEPLESVVSRDEGY